MADTFSPPHNPNYGSRIKKRPKLREATFGDGYTQRTGVGLNNVDKTLELEWPTLSAAEADTIEAFFESHDDGTHFLYQEPRAAAASKYIVREWDREMVAFDTDAIFATFERVYDL